MKKIANKGFTLIEILIVIVIIAILALVVFIALNPVGRIADSNNTSRVSNIQQIFKAIQTYTVDHGGNYPANIPAPSSGSVILTTSAYGYNITGSATGATGATVGTPYCVTGTGTIPSATVTVTAGTAAGDCVQLTSSSSLYSEISTYLTSVPAGTYYVGENTSGNKILVFATGMQQGATTDTAGYPLAYEYGS
jgi:prepilin-type N-terminal cleavage/methylation domain-containing protein